MTSPLSTPEPAVAETVNLCALCEGPQPFAGRVCIDGIWLCGPHGKVVALNRLQLTDADVEYGRRRG